MVNAHILELQGVENFRDLGGYPAGNGTVVKWGRLFRSGHMANLSRFDCSQLEPLQISALFDLRAPAERNAFPTSWHGEPSPQIFTIDLHREDTDPVSDLFDQIMSGAISRQDVEAHMLEEYARMPFEYAPILKDLIERLLAATPGALVIHCTAGKDRTGCVVALLLALLGVSWDRIVEDYLLSNQGFAGEDKLSQIAKKYRRKVDDIDARIAALRPLVLVEQGYLDCAFAAVRREMGGLEQYFSATLGVSGADVGELKRLLLAQRISAPA